MVCITSRPGKPVQSDICSARLIGRLTSSIEILSLSSNFSSVGDQFGIGPCCSACKILNVFPQGVQVVDQGMFQSVDLWPSLSRGVFGSAIDLIEFVAAFVDLPQVGVRNSAGCYIR